jgi:hypothetical protein
VGKRKIENSYGARAADFRKTGKLVMRRKEEEDDEFANIIKLVDNLSVSSFIISFSYYKTPCFTTTLLT